MVSLWGTTSMRRGKIIGALVLVAAIGLILSQQLGDPETGRAGVDPGVEAGADILVQATGQAGAEPSLPPREPPAVQAPREFTVDSAQSEVYWRIYKAGAMARLGHNHVISIGQLTGTVTFGGELSAAEWSLRFPVSGLVVDDPGIRARHGEDFASVPSDGDKEGTQRNMLTADVLNGDEFPEIRLHGRGLIGAPESAELPVTIELLGRTIERNFPARVTFGADSVTVTGEYRLTHADLGMSPFTALGGLMSVGEDIDFTYRIHAVAGGP
jgi:hypothetical protein